MTQNFDNTEPFVKRNEIQDEGGAVDITNKASGGSVGTAAATVDVAGVIRVNQTTASQTLTLPTPTAPTKDHRITVINVGSAAFTMYGRTVSANGSADFMWNSTYSSPAWVGYGSTATSQTVAGPIVSTSKSDGIGYATGAGSTGTQTTSRTTAVAINAVTGSITLVSAAGSATPATFTVTNAAMGADDTVILNQKSGTDKYLMFVTAKAAGSFAITSYTTGGTTTETPVFSFNIIKGVTA